MAYVPHSTLTGANLHYNQGDSRSATAWTLAAGTTDALLIENSNGNDLFSITTSTTPGLTTIALGNATDLPQVEVQSTAFQIVCPDDQTVFSIVANGETPVRVESSSTTSHVLRLNNAWVRMAEVSGTPTFVAGSGFLYTRDDAGTTRCTFMRDDGSTVDLDNAGGGGSPGGSDTQVQYNNAGAFGGMANVVHNDGNLAFTGDAAPTVAASGDTVLYAASEVRPELAQFAPGEMEKALQTALFRSSIKYWSTSNSTSALNLIGCVNLIDSGSRSTPTIADTNLATSMRRTLSSSTSAANSPCGSFAGVAYVLIGSSGRGGFRFNTRVILETVPSGMRVFVGLKGSTSAPSSTLNPSVMTGESLLILAADAGDSNLSIMHNSAGGTVTTIALGSSFPKSAGAVYDLDFYVSMNGSKNVYYSVRRLDSAAFTSGTLSSNMPPASTALAPLIGANSGTSASVAAIAFTHLYLEPGI